MLDKKEAQRVADPPKMLNTDILRMYTLLFIWPQPDSPPRGG
jgi:hypothetical protein